MECRNNRDVLALEEYLQGEIATNRRTTLLFT